MIATTQRLHDFIRRRHARAVARSGRRTPVLLVFRRRQSRHQPETAQSFPCFITLSPVLNFHWRLTQKRLSTNSVRQVLFRQGTQMSPKQPRAAMASRRQLPVSAPVASAPWEVTRASPRSRQLHFQPVTTALRRGPQPRTVVNVSSESPVPVPRLRLAHHSLVAHVFAATRLRRIAPTMDVSSQVRPMPRTAAAVPVTITDARQPPAPTITRLRLAAKRPNPQGEKPPAEPWAAVKNRVQFVWRKGEVDTIATPARVPASSPSQPSTPPMFNDSTPARSEQMRVQPSMRLPAAPLDAATVDRLTDDVIRRIERRVRIERERRGL